jgi:hypothetical protein
LQIVVLDCAGRRFPSDLRHPAITELSDGQASHQTIMGIAGYLPENAKALSARSDAGKTKCTERPIIDAIGHFMKAVRGAVMAQTTTQIRMRIH